MGKKEEEEKEEEEEEEEEEEGDAVRLSTTLSPEVGWMEGRKECYILHGKTFSLSLLPCRILLLKKKKIAGV